MNIASKLTILAALTGAFTSMGCGTYDDVHHDDRGSLESAEPGHRASDELENKGFSIGSVSYYNYGMFLLDNPACHAILTATTHTAKVTAARRWFQGGVRGVVKDASCSFLLPNR